MSNYNPQTTDSQNEQLTEVTQNDEILGPVSRRECHNETTKPWHRSIHVYLFDKKGKIYFSKRSKNKDTAAGMYTVSAGGHVPFGKSYDEIAHKEIWEELSIKTKLDHVDKLSVDYGSEREVITIFAGISPYEPKPNHDEVESISSFELEDVIDMFSRNLFDLSGGSRDTFRHLIGNGKLIKYKAKLTSAARKKLTRPIK